MNPLNGRFVMRSIILLVAAAVFAGCRAASPAHAPTGATRVVPPPSFQAMLVTTFGTNTSADGAWRIGVMEQSLEMSHSFAHEGQGFKTSGWSTTSPQGWKALTGWFVFVESESRVWAYNGDRQLLLQTVMSNGNHSTGTTYSSRYPCAVPDEVYSRLSEPAQRSVKKDE